MAATDVYRQEGRVCSARDRWVGGNGRNFRLRCKHWYGPCVLVAFVVFFNLCKAFVCVCISWLSSIILSVFSWIFARKPWVDVAFRTGVVADGPDNGRRRCPRTWVYCKCRPTCRFVVMLEDRPTVPIWRCLYGVRTSE